MTNADQPMDHVPNDDGVAREDKNDIEKNVKAKSTWLRLVFMFAMAIAWSIAVFVTGWVVVVNFFYVLFTGKTNSRLTEFGQALATYLYQVIRFMTFNTETRPYPIDAEWPSTKEED